MTSNKNKNFKAVIAGLFIWLLFALFSHKISQLIISKEYSKYFPLISLTSLALMVSLIAAFVAGIIGKAKGWILGCALQMVITLILVLYFIFSSSVRENIASTGVSFTNAFFLYLYRQLPWFVASIAGGYLGEKARRLRKKEAT
jgi:hypothetical protein